MKQFVTITDSNGQVFTIPDAFITAKIRGKYKDMPPFQAFGRAVEDWIEQEKKEVNHV